MKFLLFIFLRVGPPIDKCLNLRGCLCPKLADVRRVSPDDLVFPLTSAQINTDYNQQEVTF